MGIGMKLNIQKERNEVLRLLNPMKKKHLSPSFQSSRANSYLHESMKFDIWFTHFKFGHSLLTEAVFIEGGRADILCLDCRTVYEIVISEKEESLINKRGIYPKELEFRVIRRGKNEN